MSWLRMGGWLPFSSGSFQVPAQCNKPIDVAYGLRPPDGGVVDASNF
jgi:hypothetical protein